MQALPQEQQQPEVVHDKRPPADPQTGRRGRYQPLPDGGHMIIRTGFEELTNA